MSPEERGNVGGGGCVRQKAFLLNWGPPVAPHLRRRRPYQRVRYTALHHAPAQLPLAGRSYSQMHSFPMIVELWKRTRRSTFCSTFSERVFTASKSRDECCARTHVDAFHSLVTKLENTLYSCGHFLVLPLFILPSIVPL